MYSIHFWRKRPNHSSILCSTLEHNIYFVVFISFFHFRCNYWLKVSHPQSQDLFSALSLWQRLNLCILYLQRRECVCGCVWWVKYSPLFLLVNQSIIGSLPFFHFPALQLEWQHRAQQHFSGPTALKLTLPPSVSHIPLCTTKLTFLTSQSHICLNFCVSKFPRLTIVCSHWITLKLQKKKNMA